MAPPPYDKSTFLRRRVDYLEDVVTRLEASAGPLGDGSHSKSQQLEHIIGMQQAQIDELKAINEGLEQRLATLAKANANELLSVIHILGKHIDSRVNAAVNDLQQHIHAFKIDGTQSAGGREADTKLAHDLETRVQRLEERLDDTAKPTGSSGEQRAHSIAHTSAASLTLDHKDVEEPVVSKVGSSEDSLVAVKSPGDESEVEKRFGKVKDDIAGLHSWIDFIENDYRCLAGRLMDKFWEHRESEKKSSDEAIEHIKSSLASEIRREIPTEVLGELKAQVRDLGRRFESTCKAALIEGLEVKVERVEESSKATAKRLETTSSSLGWRVQKLEKDIKRTSENLSYNIEAARFTDSHHSRLADLEKRTKRLESEAAARSPGEARVKPIDSLTPSKDPKAQT